MNAVDDEYELLDILQYQSGCASISYNDPNHPTLAGKTAYICTQEQLDKFAESIIQECVDVCNRQAKAYAETNNRAPATYTADALGRMIKMHFEVNK